MAVGQWKRYCTMTRVPVVPRSVPQDVVVQIMRVCNLWVAMQAIMLRVMNNKTCKFECCYIKGRDFTYVLLECGLTSAVIQYECMVLCFPRVWQWALSCWHYISQAWTCSIGQENVGILSTMSLCHLYGLHSILLAWSLECELEQVQLMLNPRDGTADLSKGDVFGIVAKIDQWTVMSSGDEHWLWVWLALQTIRWMSHATLSIPLME